MKKLLSILAIAVLLFPSCERLPNNYKELIIGKWYCPDNDWRWTISSNTFVHNESEYEIDEVSWYMNLRKYNRTWFRVTIQDVSKNKMKATFWIIDENGVPYDTLPRKGELIRIE